MFDTETLAGRLHSMQSKIADAASAAGRSVDDITLIVVTKFHPEQLVRDLYDLGVRNVGENRHQEASAKAAACADLDLTWHFIGQLQSNKARAALDYADVIHSVDRPSLVTALDKAWRDKADAGTTRVPIDCFIQLNLTDDPGRGGVEPKNLEPFAHSLLLSEAFSLKGVMAVAPLDEDPGRAFERVQEASALVQRLEPSAVFISAGMTQDYVQAINAGATHLRIGTAITGNRPV